MDTIEKRIGLCLSGGGLRATYYHIGVICALRQRDLLDRIDTIYAVSGGSIAAAHLLSHWVDYRGNDDAFFSAIQDIRRIARRDIRGRTLRRAILAFPGKIWSGTRWTKTDFLQREYRLLFGSKTIRDYYRDRDGSRSPPSVQLLSTVFNTGMVCAFTRQGVDIQLDQQSANPLTADVLTLPVAVAASSAFPPLFPPLTINNSYLLVRATALPTALSLTDGGVSDNLGILKLMIDEARIRNGQDTSGRQPFSTILISDGSGAFEPEMTKTYSNILLRNIRATDVLMRRVAEETIKVTGYYATETARTISHINIGDGDCHPSVPRVVQKQIQSIRTDLDVFSHDEVDLLIAHGYKTAQRHLETIAPIVSERLAIGVPTLEDDSAKWGRIARNSSETSWCILNFRDWTSYALCLIAILILAGLGYGATRLPDALGEWNSDIQAREVQTPPENQTVPGKIAPVTPQDITNVNRGDSTVYIQFAGFNRNNTVVPLAMQLEKNGWKVPAANLGGERLEAAAGLNEIRYSAGSETAAAVLALEIKTILNRANNIPIRRFDIVPKKVLEVWISQ